MARRIVFSAALFVILAVTSATHEHSRALGFSYVTNGGFESGTDGWSAHYATVDIVAGDVVAPIEGQASGRVILESSPFQVRQSTFFDVSPGTYEFSAYVRRAAATLVSMQLQPTHAFDAPAAVTAPGGMNQWTQVTSELHVTHTDSVQLSFVGSGAPGEVFYIDDVRFDGAPPASATPTQTGTPVPTVTLLPTLTATKTRVPTKTPTATHTPTVLAAALDAGVDGALHNAGFEELDETGALTYWRKFGGSLSVTGERVRSGTHSAAFASATDSTKWFYETVAVSPGLTYAFSAWIDAADPNVQSAGLRVSWYSSEDGSGASTASVDSGPSTSSEPSFRLTSTGPLVAPGDARSAPVRVMLTPRSSATATIYVDDASFEETQAIPPVVSQQPAADGAAANANATRQERVLGTARKPSPGDLTGTGSSSYRVVINEVLYDPDNGATDADGEWVELYNAGDDPIDVAGWSLADAGGSDKLPALTIAPHGFGVIAASASFRDEYPKMDGPVAVLGGRIGNALGNDGDRLILSDSTGAVADAISWGRDASVLNPAIGDVPAGHSIERRGAGVDTGTAEDFVDNESPSPGRAISPSVSKPQRQANEAKPILVRQASSSFSWLPWVLAATAGTALAAMVAWRFAGPTLSHRLGFHR